MDFQFLYPHPFFLPASPAYLYGLLNINTGVSDGPEKVVEAVFMLCVQHLIAASTSKSPVSCHITDDAISTDDIV